VGARVPRPHPLAWDFNNRSQLAVCTSTPEFERDAYSLRATTTSPSFHDAGVPDCILRTAETERGESAPSAVVTVDERLILDRPTA